MLFFHLFCTLWPEKKVRQNTANFFEKKSALMCFMLAEKRGREAEFQAMIAQPESVCFSAVQQK